MAYVVCASGPRRRARRRTSRPPSASLSGPSRAEPGILQYQPHRDPENPNVFFFYEQYADKAAYRPHVESEHSSSTGFGDAIPRLESRERAFYETWEV